jgi:hypothetical protein
LRWHQTVNRNVILRRLQEDTSLKSTDVHGITHRRLKHKLYRNLYCRPTRDHFNSSLVWRCSFQQITDWLLSFHREVLLPKGLFIRNSGISRHFLERRSPVCRYCRGILVFCSAVRDRSSICSKSCPHFQGSASFWTLPPSLDMLNYVTWQWQCFTPMINWQQWMEKRLHALSPS